MSKTIKTNEHAMQTKTIKTNEHAMQTKTIKTAMFVAPPTIATPVAITVPAFPGKQFLDAQLEFVRVMDRAHGKLTDRMKAIFNAWLDVAARAGVPRDEAGCKALRRAFVEHEAIVQGIDAGVWMRSTITNYAQGVMRAYYHGLEWSPRAFQSEENGGLPPLPWSTQPKGDKAKADKAKADKAKADKAKADKADKADKAGDVSTPADEAEARACIVQQLTMIDAYGKKHIKILDLKTRDMLEQLRKIRDNIAKIGTAD